MEHAPSLHRAFAAGWKRRRESRRRPAEKRERQWRSWRTAAAVLAGVALVELVGLLALAGVRLVPGVHHAQAASSAATTAAPVHRHAAVAARTPAPPLRHAVATHPLRPRSRVSVLVLNGNGVTGDAGREAESLLRRGYRHAVPADAASHDYARSLVLFRPGWQREARRLARDTGVRAVSPLDGMKPSQLRGSQLVVILGDS